MPLTQFLNSSSVFFFLSQPLAQGHYTTDVSLYKTSLNGGLDGVYTWSN